MELSRLIKTAELFYKHALWSYFVKKATESSAINMADDFEDVDTTEYDDLEYDVLLNRLEDDLENPDKFNSALAIMLDRTADDSVNNDFNNANRIKNELISNINSEKWTDVNKTNLEKFRDLISNLEKKLDSENEEDWIEGNFPIYIYEAALEGLNSAINAVIGSIFASKGLECPKDLDSQLDQIDGPLEDLQHLTGGGGGQLSDPTDSDVAATIANKEVAMKRYREQHNKNVATAKSDGDPATWGPDKWAELEQNPARLRQKLKHWESYKKSVARKEKAKAAFKLKKETDPEFREKVLAAGRVSAAKYREKFSPEYLAELEAKFEELRLAIKEKDELLEKRQKDFKKAVDSDNTSLQETLKPGINRLLEQLNPLIEERVKIYEEIHKIKGKKTQKRFKDIEEAEATSLEKATRYRNPATGQWMNVIEAKKFIEQYPEYKKEVMNTTITAWDEILWNLDGWKKQLGQNINTERGEIMRIIVDAIMNSPIPAENIPGLPAGATLEELKKIINKDLLDQSKIEAYRGNKPPVYERHKENVARAVAYIKTNIAAMVEQIPNAKSYVEMYAESLQLNRDFRTLVNYTLPEISSMGLDDPDVVLSDNQIQKLEHMLRESESFRMEVANFPNPIHQNFLRMCQDRILREFIPSLRITIERVKKVKKRAEKPSKDTE